MYTVRVRQRMPLVSKLSKDIRTCFEFALLRFVIGVKCTTFLANVKQIKTNHDLVASSFPRLANWRRLHVIA